ncbi:MAG: AAA family ATPase, partial [Acidimicrobiales bacterium]
MKGGCDVEAHLWHVAHALAALHARSPRRRLADEAAGADATQRWEDNTTALFGLAGAGAVDTAAVARVHELACRYLDGRRALFAERVG